MIINQTERDQGWFQRLLFHPIEFFRSIPIRLTHGLVIVFALITTTFLQKILFSLINKDSIPMAGLLMESAVNSLLTWIILGLFFFAVVSSFRVKTRILDFAGAIGTASLPLVLTNILSCLILLFFHLFFPESNGASWMILHRILGWMGMALGWPGYYCYLALTEISKIPKKWALVVSAGAFMFLFFGYWLPVV
jgi:hypothetical protein